MLPYLLGGLFLFGGIYATGLLLFWIGLLRVRHLSISSNDEMPMVSVVVAARNEASLLPHCLEALLDQDYPNYEVILVDDHSDDGTWEIAKSMAHPRLQVMRSERPAGLHLTGKQVALDQAIRRSKGELILTTDADCVVPSSWIRGMVCAFGPRVGVVAGFSKLDETGLLSQSRAKTLFVKLQSAELLSLFSAFAGAIRWGIGWACTGNNLGYRKQVYQEIGGFRNLGFTVAEDNIFLQRVSREGRWEIRPVCDPETLVTTRPMSNLRSFLQQRIRWASNSLDNRLSLAIFMIVVYGFYLFLPVTLILALLGKVSWTFAFGLLLMKLVPEFLLLLRGFQLFQVRRYLWLFPLLEFLQPLYVLVCGLAGLPGRGIWKGRRF